MNSSKNTIALSGAPLVVGTVHSPGSLAAARRLKPDAVDVLELRVDNFGGAPEALWQAAPKMRRPFIVTVRHSSEGGAMAIPAAKRRALFAKFLPLAAAIDVELRSLKELAPVIAEAKKNGLRVILSHHDFARTPSFTKLRSLARRAAANGADIFKVAALVQSSRDLATLLDFLTSEKTLPLAVMGMGGEFGKISRLLFAACGSVLNYGYLDTANASGQWPAKLLKMRIAEVCASAIHKSKM